MRFKNGSPLVIYLVTYQESGDTVAFTSVRERKQFVTAMEGYTDAETPVLATYVLKEKK